MGVEGDNCTFSCDPGYMLQGSVTSGTCENTGSWSGGLPSCVPRNCPNRAEVLEDGVTIIQSSSCGLQYQSQCTVSCDEGFTGDDVTYLCNVTSDPTVVDWVPIGEVDVMCERGLYNDMHSYMLMLHNVFFYSSVPYSNEWKSSVSKWSYYWSV